MDMDELDRRYAKRDEMEALRKAFLEEARNGFAGLENIFTTSFKSLQDHYNELKAHMDTRLDRIDARLDRIEELIGIDKTRH